MPQPKVPCSDALLMKGGGLASVNPPILRGEEDSFNPAFNQQSRGYRCLEKGGGFWSLA